MNLRSGQNISSQLQSVPRPLVQVNLLRDKMNAGFSEEVKRMICIAQNYYCAEEGCLEQIHSVHHKLHDIEYNRKRFPLFIHSPFNGVGLCCNGHTNNSHLFRITEKEAQMYEDYLQGLQEK